MNRPKERPLTQQELETIAAEGRKFDAEARRALAHAESAAIEARSVAAAAGINEINFKMKQLEYDEILASDDHHQVYNFTFSVNPGTVKDCIETCNVWRRTKPECEITIVFTSPGGSVVDGLALFDYLQMLKREGHKVITKTFGMAASMAGILIQAGTERVTGREAWLMIHEASFFAAGKIGEVEDTVEWIKKVGERVISIFATRAHGTKKWKSVKEAAAFVKKNWERKDWWLSSDDALKYGFVDRIE
jgi:ATP-dependent Clp endopeptidase proteolytic subunit ClpP